MAIQTMVGSFRSKSKTYISFNSCVLKIHAGNAKFVSVCCRMRDLPPELDLTGPMRCLIERFRHLPRVYEETPSLGDNTTICKFVVCY